MSSRPLPSEDPDCGVILLAGGESRRMGRPKAWLEFAGRPLLAHLVERMQAEYPQVVVVGSPGQPLPPTPARVVYDERPGEGPVAGLAVGLREVRSPFAFVCSCDLPFIDPRVARYLLGCAGEHDIVVAQWEGRLHPLHAIYRTSLQPLLETQLAAGRRRLLDVLSLVGTRVVSEAELQPFDPRGLTFFNMNSPEEYAEALRLWSQSTSR